MPRYQVIQKRAYYDGVLIDAADEEAAKNGDGEVVDSATTDSWYDELHSLEEVDPDTEEIDLP